MTSAPKSASMVEQKGPARAWLRSSTLTSSSGMRIDRPPGAFYAPRSTGGSCQIAPRQSSSSRRRRSRKRRSGSCRVEARGRARRRRGRRRSGRGAGTARRARSARGGSRRASPRARIASMSASPAAGPSRMATATARFSSTTGEGSARTQHVVEPDDLGPVGRGRGGGLGVHRRDRGLQRVGAEAARGQRPLHQRRCPPRSASRFQQRAVLVVEQDQLAGRPRCARRAATRAAASAPAGPSPRAPAAARPAAGPGGSPRRRDRRA